MSGVVAVKASFQSKGWHADLREAIEKLSACALRASYVRESVRNDEMQLNLHLQALRTVLPRAPLGERAARLQEIGKMEKQKGSLDLFSRVLEVGEKTVHCAIVCLHPLYFISKADPADKPVQLQKIVDQVPCQQKRKLECKALGVQLKMEECIKEMVIAHYLRSRL